MKNARKIIEGFKAGCEQEVRDKEIILKAFCDYEDLLTRENEAIHITASYFVINEARDKVLCTYHKIYDTWGWGGGHADGNGDLLAVAIRECEEETGLVGLKLLEPAPVSLDLLPTGSHFRRGKYVPAHLHINVAYLFVGDDRLPLRIAEDENSAVGWRSFNDLVEGAREPFMKVVYRKILGRI